MALTETDLSPGLTSRGAQAERHAPADQAAMQQLAWLLDRSRPEQGTPYHYLLVLRFGLVNLLAMALLAAAYLQGWLGLVVAADRSHLCLVIFAVFTVGLAASAWRVWQTSRELNQVRSFDPLAQSTVAAYFAKLRGRSDDSRQLFATALRLKLSQRIAPIRHLAGSLVLLGLIGTVLGFIIALSGVDPQRAQDVDSIAPMVSTMIAGLSTALYTTLVGAVLNVWLMINYRILAGGTVKLITALIEAGEQDAGAT